MFKKGLSNQKILSFLIACFTRVLHGTPIAGTDFYGTSSIFCLYCFGGAHPPKLPFPAFLHFTDAKPLCPPVQQAQRINCLQRWPLIINRWQLLYINTLSFSSLWCMYCIGFQCFPQEDWAAIAHDCKWLSSSLFIGCFPFPISSPHSLPVGSFTSFQNCPLILFQGLSASGWTQYKQWSKQKHRSVIYQAETGMYFERDV